MKVDDEIARLARRQHGLISYQQARAVGLRPYQIVARVRSGRWEGLRRGVYVLAGVPRTWEQMVLATTMSLGPGVYASHDTALRLYGGRAGGGDAIEVSSPRFRRVDMDGVTAHRSLLLFDADLATRRGQPVTAPARVVVDLSSRRSVHELGRVVDDLLRRRLLRLPQLALCAGRLDSAPGRSMKTVDAVLRARWEGYDPGDSDLESRVLRLLVAGGLPVPRQQFRVKIGGRRCYIDLAFPEIKLAIEIDSWAYHRYRSAFDGDRARSNELVLRGWRVLSITDGMSDEEILRVIGTALQALGDFRVA